MTPGCHPCREDSRESRAPQKACPERRALGRTVTIKKFSFSGLNFDYNSRAEFLAQIVYLRIRRNAAMPAVSQTQRPARIALICSDESVLPALQESLAPFFHITFLNAAEEILPLHEETPLDAVVLDIDPLDRKS